MKKIQYNGSSKILNGIVTKVNLIIDKLIVDVKVNGTSVVVVNEEGEREADIDLSLADQNVKQSPTTDNKDYRVLLSKSDNDTEETDIARKNTDFKYNPSTGNLQATKLNGNTIPTDTDTLALNKDIPTQASDIGAIPATEKGANSGVATLDSSGKVPTTQLPSYVDDVVEGYYYNDNFYEDSAHTELITPETSKIYVDLSTDTCYRWGGSAYVEISGGAVQSDWNQNDSSQLDYIKNKPTIPAAQVNSDWNATSGVAEILNKPTIPDELADLADDVNHRLVTDTDKTTWNDERAVNLELMTEDLNDVKTVGFYCGRSGNTCTNKPSGVNQFGLYVIKLGTSNQYYKQILVQAKTVANGGSKTYSRAIYQTTWTDWVEEKYTDNKVKQTSLTYLDDNNYRILLSKSASDSEETDGVNKYGDLLYNPAESKLTTSNVEFASANIHSITTVELITSQYYFQDGHSQVVAMLEANSSSTSTNPTMLYLPSANGTLALQSDITSAINDLDVASTSIAAGETLATIKEENGKIAVTKQNIKIGLGQIDNFYRCGTNNAISGSTTWHKVASATPTPSTNEDAIIMLAVTDAYYSDTNDDISDAGILYCRVRQTTSGGVDSVNYAELKFVANSGLNPSNFRLYHKTDTNGITFEIWTSMNRRYAWRKFSVISQGDRTSLYSNSWTLYNSTSPTSAPTESATCVRVECEDNICKQTEIATSEYSNNASRAYAKNELMIWRGDLYRVTSAISSGGAISSKVTATTLSAEIKAIRDALNI